MRKLSVSLNSVLNILVVMSFMALAVFAANRYFFPKTSTSNINEKALDPGKTLSQITDLRETDYDKTLVLFLSSECSYCTKSIPLYKNIISLPKNPKLQVVSVFFQSEDKVETYFEEHGLKQSKLRTIPDIDINQSKVIVTPTVVLIDKERKILNSWLGYQDQDKEKEIIDTMSSIR